MATAPVAYENLKEARRKLKAVKPLRWHRLESGAYHTEGVRGKYTVTHRTPNRRKGIFPWIAKQGGQEIKPGGFDLAEQAKEFVAMVDAGLCAPRVIVQAAPGLPPGVHRGTLAGEAGKANMTDYGWRVVEALGAMGAPNPTHDVDDADAYVNRMEAAHVDSTITAAVIYATLHHKHVCPGGKQVELSEASEAGRIRWRKIYESRDNTIWQGWEGGGDTPGEHDVFAIVRNQLGPDQGMRFALKLSRPDGSDERKIGDYFTLIDARRAAVDYLEGELERPTVAQLMAQRRGGVESAEEAKKRLPQPDPGSGFWITRSSLTRNYFLMKGDRLVGQYDNRDDALRAATTSEAEESRRPKGPRRR